MTEHSLLILSDSHGHTRNLREALARQLRAPDIILFLGDGLRDLGCLGLNEKKISLLAVKGNCDSFSYPEPDDPDERLLKLGNTRILMMHGHTHGVKGGMERACAFAAQMGADVLLYGHTHRAHQQWLEAGEQFGAQVLQKPLLVCNPGSLFEGSFGTLHVGNDGILFGFGKL